MNAVGLGRNPIRKKDANKKPWKKQSKFLIALRKIEKISTRAIHVNTGNCPICDRHIPNSKEAYMYMNWAWSGTLFHCVSVHNAKIDEKFIRAIIRYGIKLNINFDAFMFKEIQNKISYIRRSRKTKITFDKVQAIRYKKTK